MKTVFLSGSIKIKSLNNSVNDRLSNMISNRLHVIVGDANGADLAFQEYFRNNNYDNVSVYCVGSPRNNVNDWYTEVVTTKVRPGTRAYFTAKDVVMAEHCNVGFMLWDSKSPGTLKNVVELLKSGKTSVVYLENEDVFLEIRTAQDLERLTEHMSFSDFEKANTKLKIVDVVEKLSTASATQQEFMINL